MKIAFSDEDMAYLIEVIDFASAGVMQVYQGKEIDSWQKEDHSSLTAADLLSNQIIVDALQKKWPRIPILSEESVNQFQAKQYVPLYWAVDPLDGTKEFIKKNDEFTINVALIEEGKPILGLLAAPALSLLYIGIEGDGARIRNNGIWTNLKPIIRCDLASPIDHLRVAVSRSHPSAELDQWLTKLTEPQLIPMGSSLKFCLIAEGKADCYPRFGPTGLWDTAAADAILSSLGGEIVRWPPGDSPQLLDYGYPASYLNPSFIAY